MKRPRFQHSQLYTYVINRIFRPGAPSEGFERGFTDPVILYRGAGRLAGALRPLQPPQVHFLPQVGIQGVGGVQAGYLVGQPLLDPSQLDNSPVGE